MKSLIDFSLGIVASVIRSADEFDARRAKELELVQEVVAVGTQIDRARVLADEICQCAPLAVREIKRAASVYLAQGEQAGFDEIPTMRSVTANSADFGEGIASFREKREAKFQGK